MKILVITPHYWPEAFRINDAVAGLIARGHDLDVLTALPNYPQGRFFEGYGLGGPYHQAHERARLNRVPVVTRGNGGRIRLGLNYMSFALAATVRALFMGRRRWDVVFVMQTSPVTVILPALAVRATRCVPVVAWTQDLWPDSVVAAGFSRSRDSFSIIRAFSGWLYRRCDRILSSSRSFLPRLKTLGVQSERLGYLPQWAEDEYSTVVGPPLGDAGSWALGFPVMFAGNLGRVQGLETVLAAAELLRNDPEVRWVFLGDGVMREWLMAEAQRKGLGDRVFLLGKKAIGEVPAYFARAGVLLVSLKADETMSLIIPAKVQSYLSAGRPIIGSLDGEGARVIEESGSGWASPAGDAQALAALVMRMKALTPAMRSEMGRLGRAYCEKHFSRKGCLDTLEDALEEVAAASHR
jgi:glycosyltransferase involved in cell wall biosynthesis